MMHNRVFVILVVAAFASAFMLAPLAATAVSNIVKAQVNGTPVNINANIKTQSAIALDGSDGAFGYAVLTEGGDGSLIVATTHATVCDSETQSDINTLHFGTAEECPAVWHTHYVNLMPNTDGSCVPTILGALEVADISYEEPGALNVYNNHAIFANMPPSFSGTDAVTGDPDSWAPGTVPAGAVASFTLAVTNGHVCVENIQPFGVSS
jgi:hypothetical protein